MSGHFIRIEDDQFFKVEDFCVPRHYKDVIEKIAIPHGFITDRVERLAQIIHEEYAGQSITVLCVLKGGFRFCEDLMRFLKAMNKSAENPVMLGLDFIRLKSYTNESQGNVQVMSKDCLEALHNKNVLVVEDLIDSGRTMQQLLTTLKDYQPASVKVATLLVKRRPDSTGYRPDFIGFEIGNLWISGYGGFDYNETFRDLDHICIINDLGKQKYGKKSTDHKN